jgi:hypothetical protein
VKFVTHEIYRWKCAYLKTHHKVELGTWRCIDLEACIVGGDGCVLVLCLLVLSVDGAEKLPRHRPHKTRDTLSEHLVVIELASSSSPPQVRVELLVQLCHRVAGGDAAARRRAGTAASCSRRIRQLSLPFTCHSKALAQYAGDVMNLCARVSHRAQEALEGALIPDIVVVPSWRLRAEIGCSRRQASSRGHQNAG